MKEITVKSIEEAIRQNNPEVSCYRPEFVNQVCETLCNWFHEDGYMMYEDINDLYKEILDMLEEYEDFDSLIIAKVKMVADPNFTLKYFNESIQETITSNEHKYKMI